MRRPRSPDPPDQMARTPVQVVRRRIRRKTDRFRCFYAGGAGAVCGEEGGVGIEVEFVFQCEPLLSGLLYSLMNIRGVVRCAEVLL